MRLVKAAGASFLAFLATCTEAPADPALEASADCSLVITRPLRPRLRTIEADGTVKDVGPLACASCVLGTQGAWALRDDVGVQVVVGDQRLRFEPMATRRIGGRAVPDVIVARDAAVIDRGAAFQVVDALGVLPAQLEPPPLGPDEAISGFMRRGAQAAWQTASCDEDAPPRVHPIGGYEPLLALDAAAAPAARAESAASRELVFTTGERLALPRPFGELSVAVRGDTVLLAHKGELWLGWKSGALERAPGLVTVAVDDDGTTHFFDHGTRALEEVVGPGARKRVLAAKPGHDLAGAPLPARGNVKRLSALPVRGRALVIERIENASCALEDRVHLVELRTGAIRTIASGDGLRTVPVWLGDRFAFVEADVDYESP